jgi:hypothetical protein
MTFYSIILFLHIAAVLGLLASLSIEVLLLPAASFGFGEGASLDECVSRVLRFRRVRQRFQGSSIFANDFLGTARGNCSWRYFAA